MESAARRVSNRGNQVWRPSSTPFDLAPPIANPFTEQSYQQESLLHTEIGIALDFKMDQSVTRAPSPVTPGPSELPPGANEHQLQPTNVLS